MKRIRKSIAWLGGPNSKCGVMLAITVIEEGDIVDQLLARDLHPEYHGIRRKMLSSMPANMRAVQRYIEEW